ncbi:uncharacterized protein [Littorina saxatilis]|uniref:uncharacterized protein n=1 Tax=Littorina saxatilis TaxID=31220 RepID=UPI0038B4F81A
MLGNRPTAAIPNICRMFGEAAHPVAELFRRSLAAEQVPGDWKRATVTPIFKKGSRLTPGNYRPVSLTCILCKVMEGLVRERVMKHLAENNLIHKEQHGFVAGSVCGPLLFVIYINDLPEVCSCPVRLFADDTKVYTRSDTEGGPEALQHDLDSLQQWSDNWLLRFHPDKCHTLKLGNKKSEAKYFMKGKRGGVDVNIELQESEVEKDLGVHVDNRLSFKEHVSIVSGKANQIVGVIRRTFDYLTEEMFIQLYKSLVRPKLEYGHSVWQPHNKTLCAEVENVQRRATKLIPGLKDEPYCERLKALKLPSLEHRRLRGDMIDTFKYVHGMYEADRPHFEPISSRDTRGHSLKLGKDHCRLNVRSNYFSQRVVNTWNSLPEEAVTAPSVNSFKTRIDNFWRHSALPQAVATERRPRRETPPCSPPPAPTPKPAGWTGDPETTGTQEANDRGSHTPGREAELETRTVHAISISGSKEDKRLATDVVAVMPAAREPDEVSSGAEMDTEKTKLVFGSET